MASQTFLCIVLALVCVISTSWVVGVRAAVITTQPALPLIDVAFCATPPAKIFSAALFISASASCSTSLSSPGSGCAATGAVSFNVSRAQLGLNTINSVLSAPEVYWCRRGSGGVATLVEPLQMNVVQTIPMAYARGQLSTLTFNDATPVGTTLQFVFVDGTCANPVPGLGVITLGPDRKVEVTLSGLTVGVCASIASPVSGSGYTGVQMRNRLIGYIPFNVTPNSGAEGTKFVVDVTSSNALFSALSEDALCRDLPIPTGVQTDSAGRLTLNITKPKGTYFFCVAAGDRVYYPASNMFSVLRYGT